MACSQNPIKSSAASGLAQYLLSPGNGYETPVTMKQLNDIMKNVNSKVFFVNFQNYLTKKIENMDSNMNKHFAEIGSKLDTLSGKMDSLGTKIETMGDNIVKAIQGLVLSLNKKSSINP